MKHEEMAMLALIKKSQFGLLSEIDFGNVDMEVLYNEASIQSVLGLVAPEIPPQYMDNKWQEVIFRSKASYIRYCHAEDELKKVLDDASVPFVILKGNAAAIAYKDPYKRSMGDIDFLVPQEQYSVIKNVLKEKGYIEFHDNGRHAAFSKDGILFEAHHNYCHEIDFEEYLISELSSPVIASIEGHEFPMLSPLANGLVLLDHMRRHLKSGLGLRQVIDWMMYVYHNLDDEFWNIEFKSIAEETGMDTLAITATRMCQIYLGLPETITWCNSADEKTCEQFLNCLLVSGNFGRKNGSGNSVEKVSTSIKREGLFKWLQFAGEHNWKAYHKHHWLKPFCWFYQIFRYAKQGIKTGRNKKQLKSDLDRSKERYELLKKLNIS